MKSLYCVWGLSTLLLIIISCEKHGNQGPSSQESEAANITIPSSENLSPDFSYDGGTVTISFHSSKNWTAQVVESGAESWCSVSPKSGSGGDKSITITVKNNDSYNERKTTVQLKSDSITKDIVITQHQKDFIEVSPAVIDIESYGGDFSVSISSSVNYSISILDSAKEWISEITTKGVDNKTCSFSVAPNEGFDSREGIVSFSSASVTKELVVRQKQKDTLSVSSMTVNVGPEGGIFSIEICANVEYNITIGESALTWLKQVNTKGIDNDKLMFETSSNEEITPRSGEIIISTKTITKTVIVSQEGADPILTVSQDSFIIGAAGGDVSFEVESNIDYAICIPNEYTWIEKNEIIDEFSSKVLLNITQNDSHIERTGIVMITGLETGISIIISVKQRGLPLIETKSATNIIGDSATLNGFLSAEAEEEPKVWFYVGIDEQSIDDIIVSGKRVESSLEADGSFSATLSGLELSTYYCFTACASIDGVNYYGDLIEFKTQDLIEITTLPANNIEMFSAQMRGNLRINRTILPSDNVQVFFNYSTSFSSVDEIMSKGTRVYSDYSQSDNGDFEAKAYTINYSATCYYVAVASINNIYYYGEVKSFTTADLCGVDMGLSVKWSPCNLGTSSKYGRGNYYAWGEVETKDNYSWETYKWSKGKQTTLTKYCGRESYGTVDNLTILETEDDAAEKNLGKGWRIPTYEELEELLLGCDWERVQIVVDNHLVYALLATSKTTGNSIYFPAAGYLSKTGSNSFANAIGSYWTSTVSTFSPNAMCMYFRNGDVLLVKSESMDRYYGLPIRPVTE